MPEQCSHTFPFKGNWIWQNYFFSSTFKMRRKWQAGQADWITVLLLTNKRREQHALRTHRCRWSGWERNPVVQLSLQPVLNKYVLCWLLKLVLFWFGFALETSKNATKIPGSTLLVKAQWGTADLALPEQASWTLHFSSASPPPPAASSVFSPVPALQCFWEPSA